LCPNFWKAHVEAIVRSTYKQVPLSRSAAKTAPSSGGWLASKLPATYSTGTCFQPPKLELADRIGVADHVCVVLKAGQSFMRHLGREHEEHVLFCMETMFHLRRGMPLWLLSGCLVWALGAKSCDKLKLRSCGSHGSVSCVSLLSMWPRVWQHTLGHLTSSCGPNDGI
jgi:hypothetical protein